MKRKQTRYPCIHCGHGKRIHNYPPEHYGLRKCRRFMWADESELEWEKHWCQCPGYKLDNLAYMVSLYEKTQA